MMSSKQVYEGLNNSQASGYKDPTQELLDPEQQQQGENLSTSVNEEVPQVIQVRGKYDLIADWGEPVNKKFSKKCLQGWRLFFIIGSIPFILVPVYMNGPVYMFCYATQWGIQMLCYACLLSYLASRNPQSYCLKASACVIGQMALGFNFVTMIGFWSVVAPIFIPMSPSIYYTFGLVMSHILPLIVGIINISLSDVRMCKQDIWHYLLLASVYIILNYFYSAGGDEPIYPFMSWEDWRTPVYAYVCVLIGAVCYLILALIIDYVKGNQRKIIVADVISEKEVQLSNSGYLQPLSGRE